MESSKKKVVTKVIIKNILAWVCTLCMVFCLMPSNARANDEDTGDVVITQEDGNTDGDETTEEDENTEEDNTTEEDENTEEDNTTEEDEDTDGDDTTEEDEDTDGDDTTEEDDTTDGEEVVTGIVTVTLNLDGEAWAGQTVTIVNDGNVTDCEYKDGVYTATIPLDEEVQLMVKDEEVERITITEDLSLTIDYYSVSFKDNDGTDVDTQIIRSGECVAKPKTPEGEEGLEFDKWVTVQGTFDSDSPITSTTVVYATWKLSENIMGDHVHEWGEAENGAALWSYDATSHWHKCIAEGCPFEEKGEDITGIIKAADGYGLHEFGEPERTKEPTETEKGWEILTCTTCGYSYGRSVDALGEDLSDAGEVILDSTAQSYLTTDLNNLAEAVLTDEEKAAFRNGEDLKIELTVENISRTIEESTKNVINGFISPYHYQAGQYLDIKLYKTIQTDEEEGPVRSRVSELNDVIRICIAIPDALQDTTGSKGRTYAILRMHNNIPIILDDLDNDPGTITLETDCFSTYAIIYRDAAGSNSGDNDNDGSGNNGNTGNIGNTGNTGNNGSTGNNGNNGNSGSNSDNDTGNGTTIVNNNITITNSSNGTTNRDVPKTGDTSPIGMYMTIAILSGFAYLLLFFTDKQRRMSEAEKNELIASLSSWARKRGVSAKCFAGFSIACILFYYHTVGKRVKAAVKECM